MKILHYCTMIMLIAACQKQPQPAQNHDPIRDNFVSGCLKAAAQNIAASEIAKAQQICECVYDQSAKAYDNPETWQKIAAQFKDTEIRDEKLQQVVRQAAAQCKR